MSTNPHYAGILSIEITWSKVILIKHIAIAFMITIAAYQTFLLYPRLTHSLILRMRSEDNLGEIHGIGADKGLLWINVILSILILLLTSIARIA